MIATYRYQSPRSPGEGLRLGTTRLPPRGVPAERYAVDDYFDERIPDIAPSKELLRTFRTAGGFTRAFETAYRKELQGEMADRLIRLLAQARSHTPFVIGCYCADPQQCHQRVLVAVLSEHGHGAATDRSTVRDRVGKFLRDHGRSVGAPTRKALARLAALLDEDSGGVS